MPKSPKAVEQTPLAERLKRFRKENLLTLKKAGELFNVSGSEISRIENGYHKPTLLTEGKWNKKFIEAEEKIKG